MAVAGIDSYEFFAARLRPLRPPGSAHVLSGGDNQVNCGSSGKVERRKVFLYGATTGNSGVENVKNRYQINETVAGDLNNVTEFR